MNLKKTTKIYLLIVAFVMAFALNVQAATIENYLFNENYYLAQNPDVAADAYYGTHAYEHFVNHGIEEGRKASILFDAKYYLAQNPDVAADAYYGTRAYEHFVNHGIAEGRKATESFTFDAKYYLEKYADIAADAYYRVHPYEHFMKHGINEGRIPAENSAFDAEYYLAQNPDVAADAYYGKHPYEHYIACGIYEGRNAAHVHYYVEETIIEEPTCYLEGRVSKTCTICGDTIIDTIDRVDHTYVISDSKEATCLEDGYRVFSCSIEGCDVEDSIYTEVISAANAEHSYTKLVSTKPATCTEEGYTINACELCGTTERTVLEKAEHVKTNEVVKNEATCTEDGELEFYCTVCNKKYTESIEALGHTEGEAEVENATCQKTGKSVVKCTTCKEVISEEVLPIADHDWAHLTTRVEADCANGIVGEETQYCTVCNKTRIAKIEGHTLAVTTKASCEEDGEKTCSKCGTTEVIPARGHNYEVTTEATCVIDGEKACQNTGATEEYVACTSTEVIEKLGHDYKTTKNATCTPSDVFTNGEEVCQREGCTEDTEGHTHVITAAHNWAITREATCATSGLQKCSDCGKVETIDAKGHNWGTPAVIKAPTCTETGIGSRYCATCNTLQESYVISATGHTVGDLTPAVKETCETDGAKAHYNCSTCNKKIAEDKKTILEDADIMIQKLNHNYKVVFTWADDNTVTVEAVCQNDATHKDTTIGTAEVKSTVDGDITRYTATVEYKGKVYSDVKEVNN